MGQSNRGMVAVVGGGALIGLALALAYVFYWSPKLKAEAAHAEIEEWGENWKRARTCILGDKPNSSDATEALLARELTELRLEDSLKPCEEDLKALRRVEGGSSENDTIEGAWYQLRIPIGKVAQELAWRTARTPNKSAKKLRQNLGAAISALDAGYALLRRAAEMTPAPVAGSPLPKAEVFLKLHGPDNAPAIATLVELTPEAVTYNATSKEGVVARAKLSSSNSKVAFKVLSPLALRAVNADWGLWLEDDGLPMPDHQALPGHRLVAGPLDALGEPAGDGTLLHTLEEGEKVQLSFAMGQDKRTALYRVVKTERDGSFVWAYRMLSSEDTGQSWRTRTLPDGDMWTSLHETGEHSYIASTDSSQDMTLQLMLISSDGIAEHKIQFPGTRDVYATWPPDQCIGDSRLWWVWEGKLFSMGPDGELVSIAGEVAMEPTKFAYQLLCGERYAAIHAQPHGGQDEGLHYQACTLDGCQEIVQSAAKAGDAKVKQVFHKGEWHTVQKLDGVIALWRGANSSVPEKLLAIEMEGEITGLVSWGDALLLVIWPEDSKAPTLVLAK